MLQQDLGTGIAGAVQRAWQGDDEWCEESLAGRGHRTRQRVWAEPGFEDDGITVFRICAATECLAGAGDDEKLLRALSLLTRFAALAAPVREPGVGRVSLFTSVYAHEQTAAWASRLLRHAAILQPIEAEIRAETAADLLGCRPAWSDIPSSGPRPAADEMLGVVEALYAPRGRGPSARADTEEFEQAAEMLNQGNSISTEATVELEGIATLRQATAMHG